MGGVGACAEKGRAAGVTPHSSNHQGMFMGANRLAMLYTAAV
jgi:hypothetical protein